MDLTFEGINTGGLRGFRMKNAKSWFDKNPKWLFILSQGIKLLSKISNVKVFAIFEVISTCFIY